MLKKWQNTEDKGNAKKSFANAVKGTIEPNLAWFA